MNPKISVIVPVFNVERYLKKCLYSLKIQTLRESEFILINDGSFDTSREICMSFVREDSRFKIHDQENKGRLLARKKGIEEAKGNWCIFIDGDDFLKNNDVLEYLFKKVEKMKEDILCFNIEAVGEEKYIKNAMNWRGDFTGNLNSKEQILKAIFSKKNKISWLLWDKIYRTSIVKKAAKEICTKNFRTAEDVYLLFIISFYANSLKSLKTPPLYCYRYGVGISSGEMTLQRFEALSESNEIIPYLQSFLLKQKSLDLYKKYVEDIKYRFLKSCVSRFIKIEVKNSAQAFDILLEHNSFYDIYLFLYHYFKFDPILLVNKTFDSGQRKEIPRNKNIGFIYFTNSETLLEIMFLQNIKSVLINSDYDFYELNLVEKKKLRTKANINSKIINYSFNIERIEGQLKKIKEFMENKNLSNIVYFTDNYIDSIFNRYVDKLC